MEESMETINHVVYLLGILHSWFSFSSCVKNSTAHSLMPY